VRHGHPLAKRKRVRVDDYQAHAHVAYTPVGFVPHPMSEAVPGIALHSQWWHPRFDSDPAHQWLREHVRAALEVSGP
jgi:hypothetical protein